MWIFNKKADLLVFGIPCLAIFLDALHFLKFWNISGAYTFLLFFLFDGPHVLSTFVLGANAHENPRDFYKKSFGVFMMGGLVLGYLFRVNPQYTISIWSLIGSLHFIRQQYGWIAILIRKNKMPRNNFASRLIYIICGGSVILRLTNPYLSSPFPGGIFYYSSPIVFYAVLAIILGLSGIYFLRVKIIPASIAWQIVTSLLAWTLGMGIFGLGWAMIILHGLPYIYISLSAADAKYRFRYLGYLVCAAALLFSTKMGDGRNLLSALLFGIFSAVFLVHYFWDTIQWKFGHQKNKKIANLIGL